MTQTTEKPVRIQRPTPGADAPAYGATPPVPLNTEPAGFVSSEVGITLTKTDQAPELSSVPSAAEPSHPETPRVRMPFGTVRTRLGGEPRPGFRRYWAADRPGRVEMMTNRGYVVVSDPATGKPVTRLGGVAEEGGRMAQVLMEIPEQFYREDFEAKQEIMNETDRQIYTGTYKQEPGDNTYVPAHTGIKVSVSRGAGR